ncbi:hypothetical protein Acy02nite_88010 [Actinoplanes cyaneus]|uniref:Uncharacterized protein n=1 Tax=Actinoplanes cyaneus TaxID=52696 RepID=A0A919IRJ9_9ACTN|nr:hypothetical protein Acy02nite_88010 [Actinoplanes cyaneus]
MFGGQRGDDPAHQPAPRAGRGIRLRVQLHTDRRDKTWIGTADEVAEPGGALIDQPPKPQRTTGAWHRARHPDTVPPVTFH